MEPTRGYPLRRFEDGRFASEVDLVVTETRVTLDVNDGRLELGLACLPLDLEALAVGFLLGEGVIAPGAALPRVEFLPAEARLGVRGEFDAAALERLRARWTRGSACGGGGTAHDVESAARVALAEGPLVEPATLLALGDALQRRGDLWRRTGGVHACALADGDEIALFAEDIGRHNAFDKVMGMAAMGGIEVGGKVVLCTGRLSGEIVARALACGVSFLASRSAVTTLALRAATHRGLTLVGFLRGRRFNVYSGQRRVVGAAEAEGL